MRVCVSACGMCMVVYMYASKKSNKTDRMDVDPNDGGASAGSDDDMDVSGLYM